MSKTSRKAALSVVTSGDSLPGPLEKEEKSARPRRAWGEVGRLPLELSAQEVADDLGMNEQSIRRYAGRALGGDSAGPLDAFLVRREPNGRLWLQAGAVDAIRERLGARYQR